MNVKPGENVLIVTDDEKYAIGQTLYQAANFCKDRSYVNDYDC